MFDTTTKGACVALQSLPYGMDQTFEEKILKRYPLGPVFVNCRDLNYLACEANVTKSTLIHEEEITVQTIKNQSIKSTLVTFSTFKETNDESYCQKPLCSKANSKPNVLYI